MSRIPFPLNVKSPFTFLFSRYSSSWNTICSHSTLPFITTLLSSTTSWYPTPPISLKKLQRHRSTLHPSSSSFPVSLFSRSSLFQLSTIPSIPFTPVRPFSSSTPFHYHSNSSSSDSLQVHFITNEHDTTTVPAKLGQTLLDVAHENDIDLEGACEGSLACSTCHVIVNPEYYSKLSEPSDEENDMLDLAFGLTETSRLGCQIVMSNELNNIRVRIPSATRNIAVDGYKPKHH